MKRFEIEGLTIGSVVNVYNQPCVVASITNRKVGIYSRFDRIDYVRMSLCLRHEIDEEFLLKCGFFKFAADDCDMYSKCCPGREDDTLYDGYNSIITFDRKMLIYNIVIEHFVNGVVADIAYSNRIRYADELHKISSLLEIKLDAFDKKDFLF